MLKFSVSGQAFTPVPTIFLKEYMCDAPQDYVRVYLYGLYLAYERQQVDLVEMEEALHMSATQIEHALKYWAQKGFVQQTGSAGAQTYTFIQTPQPIAAQQTMPAISTAPVYQHQAYNRKLEALLGRQLSPSDLEKIHDYTEVFGLPHDVVLLLIENTVAARGSSVNVAYLDKVAQSWADEGVHTVEKAKQKLEDYKAANGGARAILRRMGITGKNPDKTQLDLYTKWTEKWGFTQEAISFAMKDVEFSMGSPFKYLDAILRSLYEKGITTSAGISKNAAEYEQRHNCIKDVLRALDYSRINIRGSRMLPASKMAHLRWRRPLRHTNDFTTACLARHCL